MNREQLAAHEAAHAAACFMLDLPMISATILPDRVAMGHVALKTRSGIKDGRKKLTAALAGLHESDRIPLWPPRFDQTDDEAVVARLCHEYGFGEDEYRQAASATRRLRANPDYKDVFEAYRNNLLGRETMSGEELNRLGDTMLFGLQETKDWSGWDPDATIDDWMATTDPNEWMARTDARHDEIAAEVAKKWQEIETPKEVALLADHARSVGYAKALAKQRPDEVGHLAGRIIAWW